jgi:hypothetical protein
MVVKIKNETDLENYFKTFTEPVGLSSSEYVDTEEDADALIAAYFRNRYKGPVLFVGIMESRVDLKQSLTFSKSVISLTVLVKYDKKNPDTLSRIREEAKILMINVLHKIREDWENTVEASGKTEGMYWSFEMPEGLLLPVGDVANAGCRGWFGEVTIGWPVKTRAI